MNEFIDRKPAVAGKFYPAKSNELQSQLTDLFSIAEARKVSHVRAIISPHAGYVFSGKVAASAFNQIDTVTGYKKVFIIASSHHESFNGASIYCDGDFLMPYGKEKVDIELGKTLTEKYPDIFTSDNSSHRFEHSIEVQLPFLHYKLKSDYSIIPIIIGTSSSSVCKKIADALKTWFQPENLFVISSDFSHYPEYSDARKVDAVTKDAILTNNPDILLAALKENAANNIPNLLTSLCGWTSVLTLMYMTALDDSIEYNSIIYRNSGDARFYGEKDKVVGYWGITVSDKFDSENDFDLSESDKKKLLGIARGTIEELCRNKKRKDFDVSGLSSVLKTNCGAFVSLHENGRLRGCIGRLIGNLPLYKMVQEMAVSSAIHDYRFNPVEAKELDDIVIEISVLSPLKKIDDIAEIQLGKHGILVEKGHNSGVFLPQVAKETGWDKETFLGHCARDKAGLEWDGWKTADIYIFSAIVFSE